MVVRIQLRHDAASAWTTANPILLTGEVGVETDTNRIKIGVGQRWNNTIYADTEFIHKYGDETIGGLEGNSSVKTFVDGIKIGATTEPATDVLARIYNSAKIDGKLEVDGALDVEGTAVFAQKIEGIVDRAYKDEDGNNIKSYYQQLLTKSTSIIEDVDWNDASFRVEGVFNVNVAYWNALDCHDPSEFNTNICKQGILIVHVDKIGNVIQKYVPIGTDTTCNYTTVTRYKTINWTSWKSQVSEDTNIVHTIGNEIINGNKEFAQEIYSSNGKIYLSTNLSNTDTGYDAVIARRGSGTSFDNILNRKGSGELILSGANGISLRPLGEDIDNLTCTQTTGASLTDITCNVSTFRTKLSNPESGMYLFLYNGTTWYINGTAISGTMSDYGITFNGSPNAGDVLTANYNATIKVNINTSGVVDGKCTKDGIGNIITDTYATKVEAKGLAVREPEFIDSATDLITFRAVKDILTNSTGPFVDVIKKDNYITAGTVTIGTGLECGVASGFSTTNCIDIPSLSGTTDTLYIQGKFVLSNDLTGTQCLYYGNSDNYMNLVFAANNVQSLNAKVAGIPFQHTFAIPLVSGTDYAYTIELDDTSSNFYINDILVTTGTTLSSAVSLGNIATKIGSDGTNYFKGYIDLNAFRISKVIPVKKSGILETDVYEAPVYQPCLQIPYYASKCGAKIVEYTYADRVQDCYNQFRTGNYFTILVPESVSELGRFRLPFDSPNGLSHIIEHWRSNSSVCEYDTNLECSQSGSCTNGTPVVFHKPYADNNYSLIGITYSAKTATGFTPSADGFYHAKGRITLG